MHVNNSSLETQAPFVDIEGRPTGPPTNMESETGSLLDYYPLAKGSLSGSMLVWRRVTGAPKSRCGHRPSLSRLLKEL